MAACLARKRIEESTEREKAGEEKETVSANALPTAIHAKRHARLSSAERATGNPRTNEKSLVRRGSLREISAREEALTRVAEVVEKTDIDTKMISYLLVNLTHGKAAIVRLEEKRSKGKDGGLGMS